MYHRHKHRIKEMVVERAKDGRAGFWLNLISFLESSFFPIPPDFFLAPVLLIDPKKWLKYTWGVFVYSVLGGVLGYLIGYFFFSIIGDPIVEFYGLEAQMVQLSEIFNQYGFVAIFIAAFSPIPYKVFTISAGLFHVNFFIFLLASIVGRGLRFFIVGYLVSRLGQKYGEKVMRYFDLLSLLFALLIILYLLIKLI